MSKCKIRGIHTACGFKVDLNSFESYINVYVFQANDKTYYRTAAMGN